MSLKIWQYYRGVATWRELGPLTLYVFCKVLFACFHVRPYETTYSHLAKGIPVGQVRLAAYVPPGFVWNLGYVSVFQIYLLGLNTSTVHYKWIRYDRNGTRASPDTCTHSLTHSHISNTL